MSLIRKYKHTWIIPVYGLFYMLAFTYLEQRTDVQYHIIRMKLDDYIPFCEYFIVPYLMWFAYIAITVFFFAFLNKNKEEYYHLVTTLGIGMTLFLVVSYLYPNAQDLRPILFPRDNVFVDLVRHLYTIDTPTNVLPSIHVFNSVAACTAVLTCERLRNYRVIRTFTLLLTISIVMATVLLKQHTFLDVLCALALNVICYAFVYKSHPSTQIAEVAAK